MGKKTMSKKKSIQILVLLLLVTRVLLAQEPQIINVSARTTTTLNGVWKYVVDPYETGYYDYRLKVRDEKENINPSEALFLGHKPQTSIERVEYDFDKSDNIIVPRDWNSQKEKLFYYEGTVWYYKKFDYKVASTKNRQFLYIGAANYETDVYLNGKKLGKHVGGFTPFNYEITDKLNAKGNFVIIKVDNKRSLEQVPTVNTDWWNYGGITRDIMIIEESPTFVEDYYIQLAKEDNSTIEFSVTLNGSDKANQTIEIKIPEAKVSAI